MSTEFHNQNSCGSILNNVRMSGLNFCIQETPFSCYVTIRKSPVKTPKVPLPNSQQRVPNPNPDCNIDLLKSRISFLENANEKVKNDFHRAVEELEVTSAELKALKSANENKERQLDEAFNNVESIVANKTKHISEEKRALQVKHEKSCAENKELKSELKSVMKNLNSANLALKTSKKENTEASQKFDKELKQLELKVKDLEYYKQTKILDEKEFKVKNKKVEKKLKSLGEREANLKLEKTKFEKKKAEKDNENNLDIQNLCSSDILGSSSSSLDVQTSTINTMDSTILDNSTLSRHRSDSSNLDILDNSDENFSHLPLIPIHNPFQVLNQSRSCDIPIMHSKLMSCPVPTSSLDPPCSLETNLNPSNNSLTMTTSKNPNIDQLSPSEEVELRNALKKLSENIDAMNLKIQESSDYLKRK